MTNRRFFAFFMALLFVLALSSLPVLADGEETAPPDPVLVHLNLSDKDGNAVLSYEEIEVQDLDENGLFTVKEALASAAAKNKTDFAAEGETVVSFFDLEHGNGFCLYADRIPVESLDDEIKTGSVLTVYPDRPGVLLCFFESDILDADDDEDAKLHLFTLQDGEEVPLAGAVILLNGKESAFVTDEDGNVTLRFDGTGYLTVSAKKEGADLVPPVCAAVVTGPRPNAGDKGILLWALLASVSIASCAVVLRRKPFDHIR